MFRKNLICPIVLLTLSFTLFLFNGCSTRRESLIEDESLIELRIREVKVDQSTMRTIIVLEDLFESITLSMWIGASEAFAIATEIEDIRFYRPMTHDLMTNILNEMQISVIRVVITEIKDNTYYAVILIKNRGREFQIDSRPSDAIAIALRTEAPIFLSSRLLNSKGVERKLGQL